MPHERECSRRLLLSMSAAEPSADGLSTATVSHHQTPTDSHAEDETPLPLDRALEEGVNRALRGDTAVLRQVVGNQVAWRGPMGNFAGLTAVEGELRGVGQLLREPRWTVFKAVGGVLEWVASGTWPLPWLPRFIVRGKSVVKTGADGKVTLHLKLSRSALVLRVISGGIPYVAGLLVERINRLLVGTGALT